MESGHSRLAEKPFGLTRTISRYTAILGYALWRTAESAEDLEGAIAAYRESIRLNPDDAINHNNLGLLRAEAGDLDGAITAHQDSIRINAAFNLAHHNLSLALKAKGSSEEALEAHREAIRLDPERVGGDNNIP